MLSFNGASPSRLNYGNKTFTLRADVVNLRTSRRARTQTSTARLSAASPVNGNAHHQEQSTRASTLGRELGDNVLQRLLKFCGFLSSAQQTPSNSHSPQNLVLLVRLLNLIAQLNKGFNIRAQEKSACGWLKYKIEPWTTIGCG
jgi:hypothetical protein